MSTNITPVERQQGLVRTVLASTTETETGTQSGAVYLPDAPNGYLFVLDVTAAATDAGDTLDVSVETALDGTNYVPAVAFTQATGNGGAVRHVAKVSASTAQAMFEASTSLSAGSVRHIIGDLWRVKWTIADASTDNASFTFSVSAIPF
jgi:hypothetical protein